MERDKAAQGAMEGAGAQTLNDTLERALYQKGVSGLDVKDSAARTELKMSTRERLTPAGDLYSKLKEAAKPPRAGGRANISNDAVNATARNAKVAGGALLALGLGVSVFNVASAPVGQHCRTLAQESGGLLGATSFGVAGGGAGATIGAWIGGGVGALFGGVGAIPGAAAGAAVGGFLGALGGGAVGFNLGSEAGNNVYDFAAVH
jgi:hypothetical protein